ncbi:XAC2610-related protein [Burkholderia ubonensis]|uniref:XAC2610-related protein n=1 Tax=Burkholderia ubonensis TaxID=101571 RepID=UPI0012F9B951|nr:hypothetical protein [Burkholderia ubonensis]
MKISWCVVAAFLFVSSFSAFSDGSPSVVVSGGRAYVTTPTGKMQVIIAGDLASQGDAKFVDLTFNGYVDLLILRDRGASQEFYDVYLYSRAKDAYIYNKRLSNIPCLSVDGRRKELIGRCFHEDACENWEEHYSVSPNGYVSLVERRGVYCDSISGQGYYYIDNFKNGRKISSKVSPIGGRFGN